MHLTDVSGLALDFGKQVPQVMVVGPVLAVPFHQSSRLAISAGFHEGIDIGHGEGMVVWIDFQMPAQVIKGPARLILGSVKLRLGYCVADSIRLFLQQGC